MRWSLQPRPAGARLPARREPFTAPHLIHKIKHRLTRCPGDRKDVFRWTHPDQKPVAGLEISRPCGEEVEPAIAERMAPDGAHEIEAAGVNDGKFGNVMLLRPIGRDTSQSRLAFLKRVDEASLRMSGWTCLGSSLPARCCASPAAPELSADWVTSAENPWLRRPF